MIEKQIVIRKARSPTDYDYFIFTVDFEKYNNKIGRMDIDEKTFERICDSIEAITLKYKTKKKVEKAKQQQEWRKDF